MRIFKPRLCIAGLLLASLPWAAPAPGTAPFVLKPDPPTAGADLRVTYTGDQDEFLFELGDGDLREGKLDKHRGVTIPGKLLKSGEFLYLIEVGGNGERDICVEIEPSR